MSEALPPTLPGAHERKSGFSDTGRRVDRLAYAALIMGAVSVVFNFFLIGPPALLLGPSAAIMGVVSRGRIAGSHGAVGGSGIALAGLILGVIGLVVNVVWLVLIIVVFGSQLSERSAA